jgi:t-SNARE complex subunit (syntaxin)
MDVTGRFYALKGEHWNNTLAGHSSDLYVVAQKIFSKIKAQESIEVQEEIEELQHRWSEMKPQLNETQQEMGDVIMGVLVEELRRVLTQQQSKAVVQLQRELNMKKFFEPNTVVFNTRFEKEDFGVKEVGHNVEWEKEAETLLEQFQQSEDQVIEVRRKIHETSALLSVLSSKAVEQQEIAGNVLDIAVESVEYVDSAEGELRKAIQHNEGYKKFLLWFFWTLTVIIWLLDFIS